MKKIGLFIFLIPFYHYVFGQIVYYNFDNANCPTTTCPGGGGIINPQCLPDWGTSHGSPALVSNSEIPEVMIKMTINGEAAFLIGGEGLFVNYPFCEDQCYKVTYKLSVGSPNTLPGTVNLFLTNDLVNDNTYPGGCLETPPNIAIKQKIAQYETNSVGLAHSHLNLNNVPKEITHIFGPLIDYGQLWIYFGPSGDAILLHEITIESLCMPTLVYDDPIKDIPFGLHRARNGPCPIRVESPGGSSGYIENNASKYTELNAPAICIKTNTWIKSSATGSFLAKVDLCPIEFNVPACNNDLESFLNPELSSQNNDALSRLSHDIRVVPNPSSDGIFDVLMPQESSLIFEYANVYDLFGRVIQQINIQNESELKIDLSNQPPNVYYLKLQPFKEYLGQRSYKDTLIRLVKTN